MTAPTTPTLDVDGLRTASDVNAAMIGLLADDVEWIEVDQRTQPRAPAVYRGRAAVTAMIRDVEAAGIATAITDGFAAGDRAALTVACTYPDGRRVLCNGLVDVREGRIARWFGVQAWDEP